MQSNNETLRVVGIWFICLSLFLGLSGVARSQNQIAGPPPIRVGVLPVPPLYVKTSDNQWEGFSVELWKAVAQILRVPFEFREFPSLQLLLNALERGEIDIIPSLAVQDRLESIMDFSQSYLQSGLAIAVPAEGVKQRWAHIFIGFFSEQVLKAVGFMLLYIAS
jgi:ABC-type amino acid transport substrate-binding protein